MDTYDIYKNGGKPNSQPTESTVDHAGIRLAELMGMDPRVFGIEIPRVIPGPDPETSPDMPPQVD